MSITLVQKNSVNSSGSVTSQAITLPTGVTQGNLLVLSIACGNNATTFTPPDASWTQAAFNQPAGSNATIETSIWYLVVDATHAGATFWTWTLSASHTVYIGIEEWNATNGWPASPLDKTALGDTAGTPVQATTITSGTTATTTQGEELWIASLAYKGSVQSESGITAGWTKDVEATLSGQNTMAMLSQVVSATGAAACQFTIGSAAYWAGCVATFKDSSGAMLSSSIAGQGTLTGTLSVTGPKALTGQADGIGTLSGVISLPAFGSTYVLAIGSAQVPVLSQSLTAKSTIGRRGELTCTVYDAAGAAHFQQYQQCALYDDDATLVWSGYLTSPVESKPGFQALLETALTATDQHYLADKRIVAAVYRNKTCGFMVNDMLTNILSAEGVTVGSIAAGPVVPVANFGYVTVAAALDQLVQSASASGVQYYWMIDQNKALWFVPYTAVAGPAVDGTQIDDGRASGVKPTVTRANPLYRNTQYAVGGVQQTGTNDETLAGDGQTRAFPFKYALNGVPSLFTLNGVSKSLGVKGQTGYNYYYAVGDPIIAQDPGQTILVSTDRLRMVYIGQIPGVFSAKNAAAITAQAALDGTSGIVEAVLNDATIASAADGLARCNQLLTQYCQDGSLFQFATRDSSIQAGQLCPVTYAPHGFSGTEMLIAEVDASDQADGVTLWYTVNAVTGPYDVTWTDFFGALLKGPTFNIAANISLGITLPSPLYPQASTLFPQASTLFPG